MSFETVAMISAVTAFIAISGICLTLINAFSHGALARYVFGNKQQPAVTSAAVNAGDDEELSHRRSKGLQNVPLAPSADMKGKRVGTVAASQ